VCIIPFCGLEPLEFWAVYLGMRRAFFARADQAVLHERCSPYDPEEFLLRAPDAAHATFLILILLIYVGCKTTRSVAVLKFTTIVTK